MKPTWDALAEKYANSDKVIIADVDCTAAGEPLCTKFGVEGFPTLKIFNPPDQEGENYEGGREEADFEAAIAAMAPACSVATPDHCTAEQKAALDEVLKMSEYDRSTELANLVMEVKQATDAHDKLVEDLQRQYEESEHAVEEKKKSVQPRIKLLKSADPTMAKNDEAAEIKDEM